MTYELVRTYLTPEGDKNPSALRKLLAGAVSGAVAQTFTYPLSVGLALKRSRHGLLTWS